MFTHLFLTFIVSTNLLLSSAMSMSMPPTKKSKPSPTPKTITFIRHGRTFANEYLSKTHQWGAPDFTDDAGLHDSPLNEKGVSQATLLKTTLRSSLSVSPSSTIVLVSPLTRTLDTFKLSSEGGIYVGCKIKACKFLAERTYLVSDNGTPLSELKENYKNVDFCDIEEEEWWFDYSRDVGGEYTEWRPNDAQQKYLIDGEPDEYFENR